jgi:hypothetical protein
LLCISVFIQSINLNACINQPIGNTVTYVNEKIKEKRKLEEEIQILNARVSELKKQERIYQNDRDKALQEKDMTMDELKYHFNLK